MNRRDLIKSAVALALYGPRFPARAQMLSGGSVRPMATQQPQSLPFPRTAIVAISGSGSSNDQHYPPTPYTSQVSTIGTNGYFASAGYDGNPCAWMGRFDIAVLGGNWEGWDEDSSYDRALLVDAIRQITNVTNYSPTIVWQYNIAEADNSSNQAYPTLDNTVGTEKWWLYESPNESGSISQSFFGPTYLEKNWAVAWPGAVNSTPADQSFSTHRTKATYNGSAEDYSQYAAAYFGEFSYTRHSSVETVVDGTIPASSYTDSRFSGIINDAMRAPNIDGFFLDNMMAFGRSTGYYDLVDDYSSKAWNGPTGPWLIRGNQHLLERWYQIMSAAYPSRTYYRLGNLASWVQVYCLDSGSRPIFNAMMNGIQGYLEGGLLENEFGMSWSDEPAYGTAAVIEGYQAIVNFCNSPKLVTMSGAATASMVNNVYVASSTTYRNARHCLAACLMGDGFCSVNTESSYRVDDYFWFDEFGGNPGTNIAKGWLGARVGAAPTAPAVGNIWIAQFENGVAICNPLNNQQQTITASQINAYLGGSYTLSYIQGVQDPTTNPGGTFSQATLADADGLLLLKSGGSGGSLAVALQGSWDSGHTSSGVTTKSVGRDSAVNAGDLLLVWVTGNQYNNVTSVVDGQFGTLSTYSDATTWDSTDASWDQMFWAVATQNYSASSTNDVTATFSSSTGYAEVVVAQFRCSSGYIFEPTASVLGASTNSGTQVAPGTGAGAIVSGGTTFRAAPMLAFAGCSDITGNGGQKVANGWTSSFIGNSGNYVPAWSVITETGPEEATWTASSSGGSDTYAATMIGLKIASSTLDVTLAGSWDSGVASGVTSQSLVRDSAVNAGDVLVVCVIGNRDNNVASVTDGQFGTLSSYTNAENWDGTNSSWIQLFWGVASQNYTASGSNEVTASFSSSTSKAEVIVAQFSCAPGYAFASSPLGAAVQDGPQAAPGTGAGAIGSGGTNFGYQPMLAFAVCLDETGSGGQTVASSGWTSGFTASSGKLVPAWKLITATGAEEVYWTASSSGGSNTYQAILVGLKIDA